jgi:hypothetical protein
VRTHFLLPSTESSLAGGGQLAAMRMVACLQEMDDVVLTTYREPCEGSGFLPDVLNDPSCDSDRFVALWGYDIPLLGAVLGRRPWAYWAHSVGYDFLLPDDVPVLAVSAHSFAYWADRGVRPLALLPNVLPDDFRHSDESRDIDVLAFTRKSGGQLLRVCEELSETVRVELVDGWVGSVSDLYRRSKVFLYDARDHWRNAGVSEGFGLHVLEALASGCHVRLAPTGAVVELLQPTESWSQFGRMSTEAEFDAILELVRMWQPSPPSAVAQSFRSDRITQAWRIATARMWSGR